MGKAFLSAGLATLLCAIPGWTAEPFPGIETVSAVTLPELAPIAELPSYRSSPVATSEDAFRYWASAEYLAWWTKKASTPPLVTTGTEVSGGVLGEPGTTVIDGGDRNGGFRSGLRFAFGGWLDCGSTVGFEAGYFFLQDKSRRFGASSPGTDGSTVLSRPFFNVLTGAQDVEIVAFPNVAGGSVRTTSSSGLQGADANFLFNICRSCPCPPVDCCQPADACGVADCCAPAPVRRSSYRVDFLAGPRWMQLDEDLVISERLVDAGGTAFAVDDHFRTRNSFYGGQVGARAEWEKGRYFANVLGKVAIGDAHQEVRIEGSTVFTAPGTAPVAQQGGLLALPTNIGNYSRDRFAVVPEIGFNAGYRLNNHVSLFAGYTFLYWSSVVRPGDQIDTTINPTQLPTAGGPGALVGAARPSFAMKETDYWAQGVNLGLEFRW